MQLSRHDARREWLTRAEHVALPDDLAETPRPHAVRERSQRIIHLRGAPITSAPGGGVKLTSAGRTGALRSIFSKTMVAV